MRKCKLFTSFVLLATTPSMPLYPQDILPRTTFQEQRVNYQEKDYTLSYDDILRLLDEIESGELEKKCTPEELEKIVHFIVFLAKEGALPDNSEESLSLDDDIEDLLNGEDNLYDDEYPYMIVPTVLHGCSEIVLCKSWAQKRWKHVKHFAKKHKKELIIGTAVVIAAVVVVAVVAVVPTAAASAVTSAAGAAASSGSGEKERKENSSSTPSVPSDISATQEDPTLQSTLDNRISSFKENIVQSQFFGSTNPMTGEQDLPREESARALGSLFAHDSFNSFHHQAPYHPDDAFIGHLEIDRKFSTDYANFYANPGQEVDFNTLSYQVRGERALEFGYYNLAVQDLGKAIEMNPTHPTSYLERGLAHFGLGEYDRSLEDYKQFTSQSQRTYPLVVTNFCIGFAKGLPKGIYDSGEGIFLFVSDLVRHPIHTGEQMFEALSLLVDLARTDQWDALSEVLVPEVRQLVKDWDTIPSDKRGELAGYAFGKLGSDIVIPGTLSKALAKGVKGVQKLSQVYKTLQTAEKTLFLESIARLESGAKIGEAVQNKTVIIAEKLGFNACEITQLESVGKNISNHAQDINFANHALQRAIERGVSRESILDALASPLKIEEVRIDHLGRPSQRFIGQKAEVVINPETQQVVSVNPTSTKKFEKLNTELSNVKDRAE